MTKAAGTLLAVAAAWIVAPASAQGPQRGPAPGHAPGSAQPRPVPPGHMQPPGQRFVRPPVPQPHRPPYVHVPPPPRLEDHWHEGRWYHGVHEHFDGWWWVVGLNWFWYPAFVDPYPDYYLPPAVVAEPELRRRYWYYCELPAGYYPYVTRCEVPWTRVLATPPPDGLPPGY